MSLSLSYFHTCAAQFFTSTDPRFQVLVNEWLGAGLIKPWSKDVIGTIQLNPDSDWGGSRAGSRRLDPLPEGPVCYVACHGMRTLAEHIESQLSTEYAKLVEVGNSSALIAL